MSRESPLHIIINSCIGVLLIIFFVFVLVYQARGKICFHPLTYGGRILISIFFLYRGIQDWYGDYWFISERNVFILGNILQSIRLIGCLVSCIQLFYLKKKKKG